MNNKTAADRLFLSGMVISMILWGLSWASGKVLAKYGDALTIAFFRFALTFLTLPFIMLALRVKAAISTRGVKDVIISSLLMAKCLR